MLLWRRDRLQRLPFALAALFFEFSNGFHDTANAVATVIIYTNSLRPAVAVVWSVTMNFVGVIAGDIAVVYARSS